MTLNQAQFKRDFSLREGARWGCASIILWAMISCVPGETTPDPGGDGDGDSSAGDGDGDGDGDDVSPCITYEEQPPPSGVFRQIVGHNEVVCGLTEEGEIECWGPSFQVSEAPTGPFTDIALGSYYGCGLRENSQVECWRMGAHPYPERLQAVLDAPQEAFTDIDGGSSSVCGLRSDGTILCWGEEMIAGERSAGEGVYEAISFGRLSVCALTTTGKIDCWGHDLYGEATPPAGTYSHVEINSEIGCALGEDGSASCWGNESREAGDGVCANTSDFNLTPPGGTFIHLAIGGLGGCDICGVRSDHSIVCWGAPYLGQWISEKETELGEVNQLVLPRDDAICALRTDGSLHCVGEVECFDW